MTSLTVSRNSGWKSGRAAQKPAEDAGNPSPIERRILGHKPATVWPFDVSISV
jgi:hypothetical protein